MLSFPSEENKTTFKKIQKSTFKIIRNAKTKFYFDSFREVSKSPEKIWELINSCLNRSPKTSTPSEIKDAHGHIIERELEIANYMNLHFASIGQSVANKLQHNLPYDQCDYRTYLVKPSVKSMFLTPVTEKELANIVKLFKNGNSPGIDESSTNIVKVILPSINKVMCHLINLSFDRELFRIHLRKQR